MDVQRTHRHGVWKLHDEGIGLPGFERGEIDRCFQIAIQRPRPIEACNGRGDLGLQRQHRLVVTRDHRKREHDNIAVVVVVRAGLRERDRLEFAAVHMRCAPHEFLHGKLRRNPRATGSRATRGARHPKLQAEALAFFRRMLDQIEPVWSEHTGITRRSIRQTALPDICDVRALEPDAFHGFEVFGDSLLGDLVIHPMPPGAGTRGIRRVQEFRAKRSLLGVKQRGKRHAAEKQREGRGFEIYHDLFSKRSGGRCRAGRRVF